MTTPINSRRGLRTPLANAVRRREAEAVMERGLPEGLSEDEVLRGTSSYERVPGMRRAFQGSQDAPRQPDMTVRNGYNNLDEYARNKPRNMKKGGLAKAKPPSKRAAKPVTKATRPAARSSKRSAPR